MVPCLLCLQTSEKGKATLAMIQSRGSSSGTLSAAVAAAADDAVDSRDWADLYEDFLDAELEEDEEIESYYFSSAAGRARVVLGNRRWGEGGYMRAGALCPRFVPGSLKFSDLQPGLSSTNEAEHHISAISAAQGMQGNGASRLV